MTDGSALDRRLAQLPPDKRALLEQALLARRRKQLLMVTPRDRSLPTPLSASQRRLWFFDQLDPGRPTYNAVIAMWVRGSVDADALEAAFRLTIERHEILRTGIRLVGDEPVEEPLEDWRFSIEQVRVEASDSTEREQQALEVIREAARRPYDLSRDLTLRVVLVELEPDLHALGVLEHHIAFDGWSDEVLFDEVSAGYAAFRAGRTPALPELSAQYGDFAVWQRRLLDDRYVAELESFWRKALDRAPAVLTLPLDRERPDRQTFDGVHLPLSYDASVAAAVRDFSQRTGSTTFMVLVAAAVAALYRWTGQDDITVGTPAAHRNDVALENLIGFFSNTLPLRIRFDGSRGFDELVSTVRTATLAAFDHQALPFDQIVEAVKPERDPRVNPLFQVNVRVQTGPAPLPVLPPAVVEAVAVDLGYSRFDLAVEFQVTDAGVEGYVEYNRALFEGGTAQGFVTLIGSVLHSVLYQPERPLWDLPTADSSKRRLRRGRSESGA